MCRRVLGLQFPIAIREVKAILIKYGRGLNDKVSYTSTYSPVTLKMTGLFCAGKKEVEMKLIMAVLVIRAIISLFEKNKNVTGNDHESRNRVIHPAEFEIR